MLIDSSVSHQAIHNHLAACGPCRELLAYSRRAADHDALTAWRRQLAVHLEPFPRPAAPPQVAVRTSVLR